MEQAFLIGDLIVRPLRKLGEAGTKMEGTIAGKSSAGQVPELMTLQDR